MALTTGNVVELDVTDGRCRVAIRDAVDGRLKFFNVWSHWDDTSPFSGNHRNMWISQLQVALVQGLQVTLTHGGAGDVLAVELTARP